MAPNGHVLAVLAVSAYQKAVADSLSSDNNNTQAQDTSNHRYRSSSADNQRSKSMQTLETERAQSRAGHASKQRSRRSSGFSNLEQRPSSPDQQQPKQQFNKISNGMINDIENIISSVQTGMTMLEYKQAKISRALTPTIPSASKMSKSPVTASKKKVVFDEEVLILGKKINWGLFIPRKSPS